ncbi:hypothetical protein [Bacillus licheniformis]|uniref:hypothetical protein n=1 Tax=Bacillus licheniformis TaxID=1402 RepID=UPI000B8B4BE3|nr:hypothetical protein [Bacillus licheniformis]MED0689938.1 hypothetical protein [Bacillus licheniformis]MED0713604.1 hypothetical protein [Bacillus licheniformis]MED0789279.1 hypothetical protein [Bacillus licheniformis]TWM10471.1 hypothetical protein CHCC15091_0968 [Bacillus licheniformis]WIW99361.1 hypothetical protein QQ984_03515 [Bacillus licheniformis]
MDLNKLINLADFNLWCSERLGKEKEKEAVLFLEDIYNQLYKKAEEQVREIIRKDAKSDAPKYLTQFDPEGME